MPSDTLSPAAADKQAGGKWFTGYAREVTLVDEPLVVDDMQPYGSAAGDPEYVIFKRGLTVKGTLDLGRDIHSIFVVKGTLRAKRLILGDAVLVVTERVIASDFVLGPPGEGIFEVAGQQIEGKHDKLLAAIDTPVLALFDRTKREYVLCQGRTARTAADTVDDILDVDEIDTRKLRARLEAKQPVFRAGLAAPKAKSKAKPKPKPASKSRPRR